MLLKIIVSTNFKTRFVAKCVLCRCLTTTGYPPDSFQFRILNYFENSLASRKSIQNQEISTQVKYALPENFKIKQQFDQLLQDIDSLSKLTDKQIKEKILGEIDPKWSPMVQSLPHMNIFNLLIDILKTSPHIQSSFVSTQLYKNSLDTLMNAVESDLLDHSELVQLLFFISLQNDESSSYINYLKSFLPDLNELDLMDKCIISQAFYRCSKKLSSSQSRILEKIIEEKSDDLIKDPLLLVCLCKIIRISGPSDKLNLKNLSSAILNLDRPLTFTTSCHILSLYAQALMHEPQVTEKLIDNAVEELKLDAFQHRLRIKDFDRFLWSISYLGVNLNENKKILLRTYLKQRSLEYKRKENLGLYVNSTLCLHLLGSWSKNLLIKSFDKDLFKPIFEEKFHWKVRSRFQLLITQIQIELGLDVPEEIRQRIKIEFTPSEELLKIKDIGKELTKKGLIRRVAIECPINTLNIPGLTFTTKNSVYHADILNNSTCLRNTNIPHGLMQLKIRLMKKIGKYKHFYITADDISQGSDRIQTVIEENIFNNLKDNESTDFNETEKVFIS
ncbi:uncharacterized protein LOC106659818 [Trichogramma pretiosum]|uniref:uncharacterized protein LOC106659818 n=1 Tax=Trichogramma pretiosum TaxID=7493 RepID=UPI0006C98CE3|nr:uncharacterized protein LOC106659818 [Trichogramma pretiosum]